MIVPTAAGNRERGAVRLHSFTVHLNCQLQLQCHLALVVPYCQRSLILSSVVADTTRTETLRVQYSYTEKCTSATVIPQPLELLLSLTLRRGSRVF